MPLKPTRVPLIVPPPVVHRASSREHYNMLHNWITKWDFEESIDAAIIGTPYGITGESAAPNVLRDQLRRYATRNANYDTDPVPLKVRDVGNVVMHPTNFHKCHENVETALTDLYEIDKDFVPIVVGGDHAVAAPSFRAFKDVRGEKVGLIDFDAHPDTEVVSTSGLSSGTPFRQLLDSGHLDGPNAVQVGMHSFSYGSTELFDYNRAQGVSIYPSVDVKKRGMADIMEASLEQAGDGTDSIYVSLDIDVMDTPWCPGTGADCPTGLDPFDMMEAMYLLGRHPKVRALDVVEIDPVKDLRNVTINMAINLTMSFLTGLYERKRMYA